MLKRHYSRDTINAIADVRPCVIRVVLCDNHGYLTFAGDCGCSVQHDYDRFAVVGTTYGWLHNTAGDIRFWQSESGARHALKAYIGNADLVPLVKPLECIHADTCTPDYWSGSSEAHIQVPVYNGMTLSELKSELHSELNGGYISGSDERTRDDSGPIGDLWFKRAHAAVNRITLANPRKRKLFTDLEPLDEVEEGGPSVYAFFVFTDKE